MDLRKLKTLIDLVEASDISELELTEGEEKVKISRQNNTGSSLPPANYVQQSIQPTVNQQPQVQSEVPSDKVETAPIDNKNSITSPMVGTFYRAASPDSAPFIDIGSTVKKGETLCIIEAMKILNEIESDKEGTISKILIEEEITPKDFFIKEMQEVSSEGGFRQASIHCSDYLSNKNNVEFSLSRGSFATILLREIMKPIDPIAAGF